MRSVIAFLVSLAFNVFTVIVDVQSMSVLNLTNACYMPGNFTLRNSEHAHFQDVGNF